jgi:hypothetical protein
MDFEIDEQALADLCPEIRVILDAELAAGGQIARVSRCPNLGDNAIVVDLKHNYFSTKTSPLPDGVKFHGKDMQSCGINDHFYCMKHDHCIMVASP